MSTINIYMFSLPTNYKFSSFNCSLADSSVFKANASLYKTTLISQCPPYTAQKSQTDLVKKYTLLLLDVVNNSMTYSGNSG